MRAFLGGLVVGAAITWLVVIAASIEEPRDEQTRAVPRHAASTRPAGDVAPVVPPAGANERRTGDRAEAFLPGTAVLRIGDRFDFEAHGVRTGPDANDADISCLDIRHGASIGCPYGAGTPDVPLAAVGLPKKAADVAALIRDAPPKLDRNAAHLSSRSRPEATGVAFVRSRGGKTYKMWLVDEKSHPDALRRSVRIAYEAVPAVEGGGCVDVPAAVAIEGMAITTKEIDRLCGIGSALPGSSFSGFIQGRYVKLTKIPAELEIEEPKFLLIDEPLATKMTFRRRGALFAASGIARTGHVVLDSYSGVVVKVAMEGVIDVESYGYLHLAGDLIGTVNVKSYATIVIDGDIRGTLKLRSYTTLLLRGLILGTLDVRGSGWSTILLESYMSRQDIERMEGEFGEITLHLKSSDLPPGTHEDIATWRKVIVGDPVWKEDGIR